MQQEDAHEPRPQQRQQRAGERAVDQQAGGERQRQRQQHEQTEAAADQAQPAIFDDVGRVAPGRRLALGAVQPADVRVPQPGQARAGADVGAVRVAVFVGVRVVLAVVGDPVRQRPLDGHRAEHREHVADRLARLQGVVREQAVVADRDAETGEQVQRGHHREVGGADAVTPQDRHGDAEGDERQEHGRDVG